jgi:diacylglycerol kinase (ATP)
MDFANPFFQGPQNFEADSAKMQIRQVYDPTHKKRPFIRRTSMVDLSRGQKPSRINRRLSGGVMPRALLLINPKSRNGNASKDKAIDILKRAGWELIHPEESTKGDFAACVRYHCDKIDCVIVGGGDGSMRAALAGVIETALPMGILPLGTANNLAKNLDIPFDLEKSCGIIATGFTRAVDVASVNGVYFFNVSGLGLSTQINKKVPHDLKKKWGPLAYAIAALKVMTRTRPFRATIEIDGKTTHVRTLQITVCNGRHYGAGLQISDEATIDDGWLDLVSLELDRWWRGLKLLPAMIKGKHDLKKGFRVGQGKEITIITRHPMALDTDGDITAVTPAHFRILPGAVKIFAPPNIERRIQAERGQAGEIEGPPRISSRRTPDRPSPVDLTH